jgi:hypothetical protein
MIIGITGAKNSGKSTFAEMLAKHSGMRVVSLADPMKLVCRELLGFTDTQLWGSSRFRDEVDPQWGFSPRRALELLGTEWGRKLDPDLWVKLVAQEGDVIIPDVRFDNEAKYCDKVVRLRRNMPSRIKRLFGHASTRGISDKYVSWEIDNSEMTLKELDDQAHLLFLWTTSETETPNDGG